MVSSVALVNNGNKRCMRKTQWGCSLPGNFRPHTCLVFQAWCVDKTQVQQIAASPSFYMHLGVPLLSFEQCAQLYHRYMCRALCTYYQINPLTVVSGQIRPNAILHCAPTSSIAHWQPLHPIMILGCAHFSSYGPSRVNPSYFDLEMCTTSSYRPIPSPFILVLSRDVASRPMLRQSILF